MSRLNVQCFEIEGPALLTPQRHGDARGWFMETWNQADWQEAGLPVTEWVQDNAALSGAKGTLRGLHFQGPPHAQAKLVRAVTGAIFDVAVDIRNGSPTYGQHVTATLSAENGAQLFVPRGFAHGYQTLTDDTQVAYKCDGPYAQATEGGLKWNDPALGIEWPLGNPVLSDKDKAWLTLADFESPFER